MPPGQSKVTSQGQISVPADVRKRLDIGPGSTLVWDEDGNRIFLRCASKVTSEDIHEMLFAGQTPMPKSLKQLKQGLLDGTRKRHALLRTDDLTRLKCL